MTASVPAAWPLAAPLLHDAAGVSLPATPASALDDRSLTPAVLWSVAGGTVAVLALCLARALGLPPLVHVTSGLRASPTRERRAA